MVKYWNKCNQFVVFLLYEVILIILANFLGLQILGTILGTLFGIITIPSLFSKDKQSLLQFTILLVPLSAFLFTMIVIGKTNSQNAFYSINSASAIFYFLAPLSFILIGFGAIGGSQNRLQRLLLYILIIIGTIILLSFLISIYTYGKFFHILSTDLPYREAGKLYYYHNEITWLFGFSTDEVSPIFLGGYIAICISPIFSLLSKEKTKTKSSTFWAILYVAIIGLLPLLLFPLIKVIVSVAITSAIILFIIYFPKKAKHWITIAIIFGIFVFVYLLLLTLYQLNIAIVVSLINKLGPLKRFFDFTIFEASTIQKIVRVIKDAFIFPFGNDTHISTNNILFDTLNQGGFIPFIFLLVFIGYSTKICRQYYRKSQDSKQVKIMILSILIAYFINSLFNYDQYPLIKTPGYAIPVFLDPLFYVILLLIGYCGHFKAKSLLLETSHD